MLEIAKEKNVYRKLTCAELGKDKEIPGCTTISYDAVVMGGAFALAHVPIECLLEIARILKPGLSATGLPNFKKRQPAILRPKKSTGTCVIWAWLSGTVGWSRSSGWVSRLYV